MSDTIRRETPIAEGDEPNLESRWLTKSMRGGSCLTDTAGCAPKSDSRRMVDKLRRGTCSTLTVEEEEGSGAYVERRVNRYFDGISC
jgi:hypothetical protein